MKKLLSILLGLGIALNVAAADRDHTLKVYNWDDYLDEDLLEEFEQWYKEQTGEEVEILYQIFDNDDIILPKVQMAHEDYDVICITDFLVERMLKLDLLLPIDRNFGETPDYTSNMAPFIKAMMDDMVGSGKNVHDYAVPYMWSTTGILYNREYVTDEEAKSWNVLKNPKFKGQIYIKNAPRDVYSTLLVAIKKDDIAAGKVTLNEVCMDASDESIALVEAWLNEVKDNVLGWEDDFGREMMARGHGWINLTYSGDAQWAIDEAAKVGIDLAYVIPEEGSTIGGESWIIPKYAKNVKAASYFINFMCMQENAIRNMEATGYVSVVGGDEVLEAVSDSTKYAPHDASYFFGPSGASACLNPNQYPDASIIPMLGPDHDKQDRTEAILAMWNRVKGDNAKTSTYIILGIAALALILGFILSKKKGSKKRRK